MNRLGLLIVILVISFSNGQETSITDTTTRFEQRQSLRGKVIDRLNFNRKRGETTSTRNATSDIFGTSFSNVFGKRKSLMKKIRDKLNIMRGTDCNTNVYKTDGNTTRFHYYTFDSQSSSCDEWISEYTNAVYQDICDEDGNAVIDIDYKDKDTNNEGTFYNDVNGNFKIVSKEDENKMRYESSLDTDHICNNSKMTYLDNSFLEKWSQSEDPSACDKWIEDDSENVVEMENCEKYTDLYHLQLLPGENGREFSYKLKHYNIVDTDKCIEVVAYTCNNYNYIPQ